MMGTCSAQSVRPCAATCTAAADCYTYAARTADDVQTTPGAAPPAVGMSRDWSGSGPASAKKKHDQINIIYKVGKW